MATNTHALKQELTALVSKLETEVQNISNNDSLDTLDKVCDTVIAHAEAGLAKRLLKDYFSD